VYINVAQQFDLTDTCLFVNRIPALFCCLQYTKHSCHC